MWAVSIAKSPHHYLSYALVTPSGALLLLLQLLSGILMLLSYATQLVLQLTYAPVVLLECLLHAVEDGLLP